jgi:hypothetical protein
MAMCPFQVGRLPHSGRWRPAAVWAACSTSAAARWTGVTCSARSARTTVSARPVHELIIMRALCMMRPIRTPLCMMRPMWTR